MYNRPMVLRRLLAVLTLLLLTGAVSEAQQSGPGYWERSLLPQQGLATFYSRGMMEYVHDYRTRQGDIAACPECVGTVALLRAGDIGRRVWLKPPTGDPVGPFLVIDCARRQDVQPLLDRNWVVDVSFELGQLWGMNRPLDGVLVFEDPTEASAQEERSGGTVRAPTPFYVDPAAVFISPPTPTPDPVLAAPGIPAETLPTPWPTRQPVPLPGVTVAPTSEPAVPDAPLLTLEPSPPTVTPGPPPLTPIITTPTPPITVVTSQETPAAPPQPVAPEPDTMPEAVSQPDAVPVVSGSRGLLETPAAAFAAPELPVSLGRAGAGLLDGDPAAILFYSALATPTRIAPRSALTPILPMYATPASGAPAGGVPIRETLGASESFWDRILREIRRLLD